MSVKSLVLCLILACFGIMQKSQAQAIHLDAAIEQALKNNLTLRSDKLRADYLEKMRGTAWNISQTSVGMEYGNVNSSYIDNRFFASQSFKFPTVYAAQHRLANQEWQAALLTKSMNENELRKLVRSTFYQYVLMLEKQKILIYTDSLFQDFQSKAQLRFNLGESNAIEQAFAETQRGQIAIQLNSLNVDLVNIQFQFQWLLNTERHVIPESSNLKIPFTFYADTNLWAQNPVILQLEKQQEISKQKLRLEKSKMLPDLFLGYNDMSMYGTGADNIFYADRNTRFRSFQIGLGIPLFFGAQNASFKSEKLNNSLMENNLNQGIQAQKYRYKQALENMKKYEFAVNVFETKTLKNAEIIINSSTQQYNAGEINFLEWTVLLNNAITAKSQYVDALLSLNESIIELNYQLNY